MPSSLPYSPAHNARCSEDDTGRRRRQSRRARQMTFVTSPLRGDGRQEPLPTQDAMTPPARLLGERRRGVKSRSSPCRTRADLFARLSATSSGRGASLLLVADVDGFREYNARHGYEAGDALLRDLGDRLAGVGDAY